MKHKKIYKRLIAFLMAFIMFFTNPFQGISSGTKVKALEYAIGSEAISEVVLLLFSLFETSVMAAGNRDGFSSVDAGFDLLNIYNDHEFEKYSALDAAGQALYEDKSLMFKTLDENGSELILRLLPIGLQVYNTVTGDKTVIDIFEEGTHHIKSEFKDKIIDLQDWKSSNAVQPEQSEFPFQVIKGTGGMNNFGTEMLIPFISLLFQNRIEEAKDSSYITNDVDGGFVPSIYYDQVLKPNARFIANYANVKNAEIWFTTKFLLDNDSRCNHTPKFSGTRWFAIYTNNNFICKFAEPNVSAEYLKNNNNWNVGEGYILNVNQWQRIYTYAYDYSNIISFTYANFPVFDSYESASAWLCNDDLSGCINLCQIDLSRTADNSSSIYEDLNNDSYYDPSSVISAGAALNAALINSEFTGNISNNTDDYIAIIAAALAENGFKLAAGEDAPTPDAGNLPYSGILGTILNAINSIARSVWSFFEEILGFIRNILQIISDDIKNLRQIFTEVIADPIIGAIQSFQDPVLDLLSKIAAGGDGMGSEIYEDTETGAHHRSTIITLANGLFLLLAILLALLRLFIHCMLFIFNIFRIPSSTAFLPDNVILGLEYLKQLEIPGIGISVYGLFMGLIYVLVFCSVIGVLRAYISRMRVPR